MKKINFICPNCGQDLLEEVCEAEVRYTVCAISEDEDMYTTEVSNDEPLTDLLSKRYYMCGCCLTRLHKIDSAATLYLWLDKRGMLKDEKS